MIKKIFIFFAEYLVFAVGFLILTLTSFRTTQEEKILFVVTSCVLVFSSVLVAKILKRLIHKKRPAKKDELFVPFDTYAFPSAHATGLASATFFISSYSLSFGIAACVLTVCVLMGRVYSRVHDMYDIVAGLLIGTFVTISLYDVGQTVIAPFFVALL